MGKAGVIGKAATLGVWLAMGAHALDVQVSIAPDGTKAQVRLAYAPEKEALAAVRLRFRFKDGVLGDNLGITKPASGPWSQFFPAVASAGSGLTLTAMAPAMGSTPDSGETEIALLEVGIAGGHPQGAADLIDSAIVEEAYGFDGKALPAHPRLVTSLARFRAREGAPSFRERGTRRTLAFTLGRAERVRAWVGDMRGRKVADILDRRLPAGLQEVSWDGRTAGGRAPARGTYIFHLEAGAFRYDRKLEVAP